MGQQFLAHWRIWLAVGLLAAAAADVLNRAYGHEGILAEIYVAVAVVALVFYVTGVVARHRREKEILGTDARG